MQLRRADGREVTVPLDRLSEEDRQYLEDFEAAQELDNPFEP